MHNINITTDELSYMLELLNNERYTSNTNAVIADTLSAVLHDASWHGVQWNGESDPNARAYARIVSQCKSRTR